jgi:hypothetical protein
MSSNIWWIGPIILVLLRLFYAEARNARASGNGDSIAFRGAPGVLILFSFGIAVFVALIVKSLGHEPLWVIVSAILLTILICLAWPSTIRINSMGVERHVWWRPTLRIPWDAVADLQRGAAGDYTLYGATGQTISFTRYHTDPERFENEVLKRANLRRRRV